ncbi:MAG: RtcB family protein [Bacteroidetes bacterium]|nr:RtcB family protein [Bacteroidota bacterium]
MKTIREENSLLIKSWCGEPEEGALEQARHLAHFPFAFKQVCLMPDTHQGYGMPIGGVIATEEVIIPNAVGVDIGCGVCAVRTSLTEIRRETLKEIVSEVRRAIPVGFTHHKDAQDQSLMPEVKGKSRIVEQEYKSALTQIGTLGGGNHFIEIQKGDDGRIWIMVHSGSRNIGLKNAEFYNKLAIAFTEKHAPAIPKGWQLAYLPVDTEEGDSYKREMQYCIEFAFANRKLMMDRIKGIVHDCTSGAASFDDMINIAHNYARLERHFGRDVWVHRKGATSAYEGEIGIVPGSQGTPSYIVKGKGNPESFMSCSHGAGRKMGRNEARRSLNLHEERRKLEERGILHALRGVGDLDEASGAYKDIDVVMREQEDLVEPIVKLEPLAVVKG